jgi:NADH-quinone oxidoreductase subunit L
MPAARALGVGLWKVGDQTLIDGAVVNGSAKAVGLLAGFARGLQSGYLYHYAFAMIVGLAALVGWLVFQP